MHYEDALLSWAVHNNDLNSLVQQGIQPAFFYKRKKQAVALFRYYEKNRQLPSLEIAKQKAPGINWGGVEDRDLPEYVDRCRTAHIAEVVALDANELLAAAHAGEYEKVFEVGSKISRHRSLSQPPRIQSLRRYDERVEMYNENARLAEEGTNRIPMCHPELDRYMGGYRPGRLYIPGGRPKKGKSHLLYADASNLTQHGLDGIFFSYEMAAHDVLYAIDSLLYKWSVTGLQSGYAVKFDENGNIVASGGDNYVNDLRGYPEDWGDLRVVSRGGRSGGVTIPVMRSYIEEFQPDYILVDYIRIVDVDSYDLMDATSRSAWVANQLKTIALDYNIVVVAPHQLNRAAEQGEVGLVHFADSDKVVQEGDALFHVDSEPSSGLRPEAELERQGEHMFHLKVVGNRFGPAGGKFSMRWNFDTGHIRPVEIGNNGSSQEMMEIPDTMPEGYELG